MADQTNAEVSDERLRECPFCGIIPVIVRDRYGYQVECHNVDCGAMPTAAAGSKSEAADAWNRRSVTSQASEGAVVAWVAYGPERHLTRITTDAGTAAIWREQGVELDEVTGLTYFGASPSKRVERLETALTEARAELKAAFYEGRASYHRVGGGNGEFAWEHSDTKSKADGGRS